MAVNYFPLDVTLLAKGQTITIAELETMFGVRYPHEYWGFKLMDLIRRIRVLRRNLALDRLTMRSRDGELVILTDEEACAHNERKARAKAKGYVQTALDNIAVDESKLPAAAKEVHQRVLMRQAMVIRGLRHGQHAKLPALAGPPPRVTPKMIDQKQRLNGS